MRRKVGLIARIRKMCKDKSTCEINDETKSATFNKCNRDNPCYICDNTSCLHAGDKGADCPKWSCDNPNGYNNCGNCQFLEEYLDEESQRYINNELQKILKEWQSEHPNHPPAENPTPNPETTKPDAPSGYDQSIKADAGKEPLITVPRSIIWAVARIRAYGIQKYGSSENWKGVEIERYRDAAFRHFLRYLDDPYGNDEESGLPHLWHCCCNLAFLCELEDKYFSPKGKSDA